MKKYVFLWLGGTNGDRCLFLYCYCWYEAWIPFLAYVYASKP